MKGAEAAGENPSHLIGLLEGFGMRSIMARNGKRCQPRDGTLRSLVDDFRHRQVVARPSHPVRAEFEQYMQTTWPKALEVLKQLCEDRSPRPTHDA